MDAENLDTKNLDTIEDSLTALRSINQDSLPEVVKKRLDATIERLTAAVTYLEAREAINDKGDESLERLKEKIRALETKIERHKTELNNLLDFSGATNPGAGATYDVKERIEEARWYKQEIAKNSKRLERLQGKIAKLESGRSEV